MSPPVRVRDAVAPAWLVETVRPRRAPVPYGLMARAALAISVPLAAGFAAHNIALGLLPAIGALLAIVVDIGGPYPARARRVASAMLAGGAPGVVLGSLIHGMGWVTVVVLVAVAGVSSLLAAALKDVATAVRSRAKPAEPTVEAGGDGLSQVAEAVRRVQASLA